MPVMKIALLAGGTGGAKLAAGLADVAGNEQLTVIANTGDDIVAHGLYISPDPDLITYWLADIIDEDRGWGIRDEAFTAHEQASRIGSEDSWFKLGDRDRETCMLRTQLLDDGRSLTEATAKVAEAHDVRARVLPMSDDTVTTFVKTNGNWHHFQEYLILQNCEPEIEDIEIRGAASARMTDQVRKALQGADVIVIGPSNPIASIGPILAVPDVRSVISGTEVPVIAVSPFVYGRAIKGPTEKFMSAAGFTADNTGLARAYEGIIDSLVSDTEQPTPAGIELHRTDVRMSDRNERALLAEKVLNCAASD